jgi:2-polyprenyl-3-methyl-5-hydroxy-6-metoxy-1,4-benzoquinol methylase
LFHRMYDSGAQVPWDTRRPQPGFITAVNRGWFKSPVLDVGCGYGDNAIFLAHEGYDVVGVDYVPAAITEARKRAAAAGDPRWHNHV